MGVKMIIDLDSQRPAAFDPLSYSSGYREGRANRPAMRSRAHWLIVRYAAATFIGRDRRGGESTGALTTEETTGSMGGGQRAMVELALSDEERGRLYDGVMRILDASVANVPAPEVADALPSGVPLQDLPFGHLEKFLSPSRHESDSVTARGHGRMERAGHGAEELFRCCAQAGGDQRSGRSAGNDQEDRAMGGFPY